MVWVLKAHPRFESDLKKLNKVEKKQLTELILRIKEDPYRFKTLKGFPECFRVRFSSFRLVYVIKGETLWLIIVDKRKRVYKEMQKRIA
ncbi:MAG: type II toxin-antitoxin system RelE/ParE family toxin [Methanosarcinaceae archaeon]|nr:type II toxin-antitoxin system RelE/ParE family toxin [Methanosarcinaceae archaeon]